MPNDAEVVVVGGGPAGLAAAIAARQAGLTVLVLDRRTPPIDKACGEGLMPDGVACLEPLGVPLPRRHGKPLRGIRYVDGPTIAEGRFPGAPGIGLRRTVLHETLVARAQAVGVEIAWQTRVDGLHGTGPRYAGVRIPTGAVRARWLVAADGLRSPLRHQAGLDGKTQAPAARRFGVRRHVAVAPWTDCVEVHWAKDAEAYVTPVADDEVGIALLWRGTLGRAGGFDAILPSFPALHQRVGQAPPRSRDRGWGPLRQRVRSVTTGNLALIGDASGYVDAITGEGISLALHQALALGPALATGNLGHYRRRHRALGRLPNAITHTVLWLEQRPGLRRRAIRALAADPGLFGHLLAGHTRARPVARVGLVDAPKLALGMMKA